MKINAIVIVVIIAGVSIVYKTTTGSWSLEKVAAFNRGEWVDEVAAEDLPPYVSAMKMAKRDEVTCHLEAMRPFFLQPEQVVFSSCPDKGGGCAVVKIFRDADGKDTYIHPDIIGPDNPIHPYDARFGTCAKAARELPPHLRSRLLGFHDLGNDVE